MTEVSKEDKKVASKRLAALHASVSIPAPNGKRSIYDYLRAAATARAESLAYATAASKAATLASSSAAQPSNSGGGKGPNSFIARAESRYRALLRFSTLVLRTIPTHPSFRGYEHHTRSMAAGGPSSGATDSGVDGTCWFRREAESAVDELERVRAAIRAAYEARALSERMRAEAIDSSARDLADLAAAMGIDDDDDDNDWEEVAVPAACIDQSAAAGGDRCGVARAHVDADGGKERRSGDGPAQAHGVSFAGTGTVVLVENHFTADGTRASLSSSPPPAPLSSSPSTSSSSSKETPRSSAAPEPHPDVAVASAEHDPVSVDPSLTGQAGGGGSGGGSGGSSGGGGGGGGGGGPCVGVACDRGAALAPTAHMMPVDIFANQGPGAQATPGASTAPATDLFTTTGAAAATAASSSSDASSASGAPTAPFSDRLDDARGSGTIASSASSSVPDAADRGHESAGASVAEDPGQPDLRTLVLPTEIMSHFLGIAAPNTAKNIETCAVLAGTVDDDGRLRVTALIFPKQYGTADTCTATNEEEIMAVHLTHDLITLGWIHSHPRQTLFCSSQDLHTHHSYQMMLREAVAVVMAPSYTPNFGVFRIIEPEGMAEIGACTKTGFHKHRDVPIYTYANHVVLDNERGNHVVYDLRGGAPSS